MYITNFSFEGPESRGGTISATELVARVIAPVNPELAADYSDDVHMYEGTAAWRTMWWIEIWNSVHSSSSLAILGHGYGFALGDLVAYLEDSSTRTPHNVFFLALGYTGWSGVIMFALLQSEIARLCWRAFRKTKQAFSIVFWVTTLAFSFFTPFFETPQGAIPFYLVAGCACAGLLADKMYFGAGGFRGLHPSGPRRDGIHSFPNAVQVGGAG
jgi:O-antigen ligase